LLDFNKTLSWKCKLVLRRFIKRLFLLQEQALAFSKKGLRLWGLTGQRGWARLIMDRLHDLASSPDDSKGSTLDPDTVAHEHHSFLFPDNGHGAANAAGFGWRNGG
jgi:hypothetical protein